MLLSGSGGALVAARPWQTCAAVLRWAWRISHHLLGQHDVVLIHEIQVLELSTDLQLLDRQWSPVVNGTKFAVHQSKESGVQKHQTYANLQVLVKPCKDCGIIVIRID